MPFDPQFQRSALILALGAAALGAGCAQGPYVAANPPLVVECQTPAPGERAGPALVGQRYGMQHSPIPLNSVQFDLHATAERVAVQGLYAGRTPTDTIEVTARFVSCMDAPQAVRVRTSFFRENHGPAEPTSTWRVVHLPRRGIGHYTEYSTSRDVATYLVEVSAE